jgi:hypothetical protein
MRTRIGASLISDGEFCYQSYRCQRYSFLGRLETCLDGLIYNGFDEVNLCLPASLNSAQSALKKVVKLLGSRHFPIPIVLSGAGISRFGLDELSRIKVIERVAINSLYFTNPEDLQKISKSFGRQFVVLNLPCRVSEGDLEVLDFSANKVRKLADNQKLMEDFDEIILHNVDDHGFAVRPNFRDFLASQDIFDFEKIVVLGGFNDTQLNQTFVRKASPAAVYMDNFALYSEDYIRARGLR